MDNQKMPPIPDSAAASQSWRTKFEKLGLIPEQCTCLKCADHATCPFAFDISNYGGACMEEK